MFIIRKLAISSAPLLIIGLLISGCTTPSSIKDSDLNTPLTHRYQRTEAELLSQSNKLKADFQKRGLVITHQQEYAYFDQVAAQVLPDTFRDHQFIQFHILKNPTTNAIALPTGDIYVFEGLIAVLENEAQLATVLAHELAHVTQRHNLKSYISKKNTVVVAHLANFALMGTGLAYFPAIATLAGHSRETEAEADQFAIDYLHDAGYPLSEAVETFRVFQSLPESAALKSSIYATHPDHAIRIKKIRTRIDTDFSDISLKPRTTGASDAFLNLKKTALLSSIRQRLLRHHYPLAIDLTNRYLESFETNAEINYLKGEAFRLMAEFPLRAANNQAKLNGKPKASKTLIEEYKQSASNNSEKAFQAFNQALEQDKAYSATYRSLGLLEKHKGNSAEAEQYLDLYLQMEENPRDKRFIQRVITNLKENNPDV